MRRLNTGRKKEIDNIFKSDLLCVHRTLRLRSGKGADRMNTKASH